MKVWVIQDGEPIPGVDKDTREWRAAMLCKALAADGHDALWWASTFDHARKKHRFGEACTIEMKSGVKIRLLHGPGYTRNKSLYRFYHHKKLAKVFAKEAEYFDKPDIIYASIPTIELSEQAVIIGQRWRIPVLFDIRDAWPDHYLTLVPIPFRKILRLILFSEFIRASRVYKKATGLIATSETYLKWALKYAERSSQKADGIFPMAYPDNFSDRVSNEFNKLKTEISLKYEIKSDELIVCFIGSFTTSFDFDTIIKAIDTINNKFSCRIKIIMVGNGPEYHRIRNISQQVSNIIFTGWLDQILIAAILKLSAIGLAPYKKDTFISLPNKPFEYMAAGLPLLSSLCGELEVLIKKEQIGLQYNAGDADSLVLQILWMAKHPEERTAMGRRARKTFEERYNAELIYPKLAQHLKFVVSDYKKAERTIL